LPQILWLASFPKSGNTWVRIFLHNYLLDLDEPQDINTLGLVSGDSNLRWWQSLSDAPTKLKPADILRLRPQVQAMLAASDRGDVIAKTHFPVYDSKNRMLFDLALGAGAIYILRNPLDVCLSLARFADCSLDRAIAYIGEDDCHGGDSDDRMWEYYGHWSRHVESWTQTGENAILVLRYEDLLQDPMAHFGRVAAFLEGRAPDAEKLAKAVNFSSFDRLKRAEDAAGFKEQAVEGRPFFRKGLAGEGAKVLTKTQIDRIVRDHGAVMQRFGYLP
jgi:hypothetical protein